MAAIGAVAAACGLIATLISLKGGKTEVHFVVTWIVCYALYLGFHLLLVSSYFTRTQILVLLASAGILSALLIQFVATWSEGWALVAMLIFPVLPFVLGLGMLRYRRIYLGVSEEPELRETETLATLVRSKRNRGLMPQAGPDTTALDEEGRRLEKRTILVGGIVVAIILAVGGLIGRRSSNLRRSADHSRLESQWSEKALEARELLDQAEAKLETDSSESLRQTITLLKHRIDDCTNKANWHAKRSEEYMNRW